MTSARRATMVALNDWKVQAAKIQATPYIPPKNPFDELDDWQREAVDILMEGGNVVVDAPTTAGKTRVVEAFFAYNIASRNFRACYTCPVKSLSNDKLREFRAIFGDANVGISTGDVKDNLDAPIVVATLESYRNSLLGIEPDLGRRLVVFDEYHYISDSSRGSAWEEAIILTPQNCQVLLLSASLSNANEFATWIGKLQERPTKLIHVEHRPVPLADLVWYGGHWILASELPPSVLSDGPPPKTAKPLAQDKIAQRLKELVALELTPCMVYAGRRLACEEMAKKICDESGFLEPEQAQKIALKLQKFQEDYKSLNYMDQTLRKMIQSFGVAYHHSGLQPPVRVAVEGLVKEGLLKYCTATMGLSLGINFSVRSAVISDFDRPGEAGFTAYAPSEVLQMLGRAGRRGKDAVGYSLWPDVMSYRKLGQPKRERIESRLKNDPATFLGLIGRGYTIKGIEAFYRKSFLRFGDSSVDLSLVTKDILLKKLGVENTPCSSPMHAIAEWQFKLPSPCDHCNLKSSCHSYLKARMTSDLASLHLHLHRIGALDGEEKLTPFGNIARFFPHNGGLFLTRCLVDGEFSESNLGEFAELAAGMCLARFKEIPVPRNYRYPKDAKKVEKSLEDLYPMDLFPDVYDPAHPRRPYPAIREFNPSAGYIIREWIRGTDWTTLVLQCSSEYFGAGDISAIIFRVASYLQSLAQADLGPISDLASDLRKDLLRHPLDYTI
jgi:superfamily II RNA helicase